jgi:hypothetical protein
VKAARQKFEHGELFWYDHPDGGLIFAVAIDTTTPATSTRRWKCQKD